MLAVVTGIHTAWLLARPAGTVGKAELGDTKPEVMGQAVFSRKVVAVNAHDTDGPGFKARISLLQSLCFHHCTKQPAWEQIPKFPNPDQVLPPL